MERAFLAEQSILVLSDWPAGVPHPTRTENGRGTGAVIHADFETIQDRADGIEEGS